MKLQRRKQGNEDLMLYDVVWTFGLVLKAKEQVCSNQLQDANIFVDRESW